MFIMPFVKASFFNLVQIVAQSMADLRWVRAEKTAAAIDREFSAVKITDCLKTGVNTAGNPERVSPVNYHTECPAQVADWLLLTCNPLIGRSPQPSGGRLARRQPLKGSVEEQAGAAFTRSWQAGYPGNRELSRLIHS